MRRRDPVPGNLRSAAPHPGYVVAGAMLLLATGCATTDSNLDANSAAADVAVIQGASRASVLVSPTPVIIRKVDGKSISGTSSAVRVQPGPHTLLVTCYESMFAKNTHELTVTVAAGKTYELVSRIDPNKISDNTPDCEARLIEKSR